MDERERVEGLLDDLLHNRLPPEEAEGVREGLARSPELEAELRRQGEVAHLMRAQATRHEIPGSLERRLERVLGLREVAVPSSWVGRLAAALQPTVYSLVASALVVLVGLASYHRWVVAPTLGPDPLVREVVGEHLRVLISPNPVQTRTTELPRIRNWFRRYVPYEVRVAFPGDEEMPLAGGRVGFLLEDKVAELIYGKAPALFTLRVLPARRAAEYLELPEGHVRFHAYRGYTVALWRKGDLLYALAGEGGEEEFRKLASRIAPP